MQVKISTLPYDIQKKIPLSIRIQKDTYELSELPLEVQTLIKAWLEQVSSSELTPTFYDVMPKVSGVSVYQIRSLKELAAYYVKTYLLTPKGSYPGDVTFGSDLRKYLQIKDEVHKRELISKEVHDAVNYVSRQLGTQVTIKDLRASSIGSELYITVTLMVQGEEISLTVAS